MEKDLTEIDIERMKKALESETIKVPPGMSKEELREFIKDATKEK